MSGLIIRLARTDERLALEALQRRASLELEDYREQLLAHPDEIQLPAEQIERGEILVAERDGEIAGFAAIVGSEIDGLFVEPPHWRQGIGRAMVEAAVHEARRRGQTMVAVVANPTAKEFYEKCGFAIEGVVETKFGPAFRMSR